MNQDAPKLGRRRDRRRCKGCCVFFLLLILMAVFQEAPALQSNDATLEGFVVDITEIGSDFFVYLDLNEDGAGEVWVKLIQTILDMQGNALKATDITIGVKLKLIEYVENETGFIEATKVVVISNGNEDSAGPNQGTLVNVFARIPGTGTPVLDLFNVEGETWVCKGEKVTLYWVTSPDVTRVSLGETLGVFEANRGGVINGLNWGSVTVEPTETISYIVSTLDGTFDATNSVTVKVFDSGTSNVAGSIVPEGKIKATLVDTTAKANEVDEWVANLPDTRFSDALSITDIKPTGDAVEPGFIWRIRKEDPSGQIRTFSIAATEAFQHPFRPEGTDITFPLNGVWTFSTPADISTRTVEFVVRPVCEGN